jgi:transcriptional regulator GlxA family with amidase domain
VLSSQIGGERSISGAGDGSRKEPAISTVAEVMQRTKTCRGDIGLTLRRMSTQVDLPAKYLGQEFHDIAGIRFRDYSRTVRLLHAARLLSPTDGAPSLKEVAHRAGYGDEGDFGRDFSRVFLQGPAAYRRSYRLKLS